MAVAVAISHGAYNRRANDCIAHNKQAQILHSVLKCNRIIVMLIDNVTEYVHALLEKNGGGGLVKPTPLS